MDMGEVLKPEYFDIENPVEFLMDAKISTIRYKLNTSGNEMKKLAITAASRTDCNSEFVINVMSSIDRSDFVPSTLSVHSTYMDGAQSIGWNTTVSAPHMHMITLNFMSKFVDKYTGVKINAIDIGTGSGFMALAMSKLFGPDATIYALDHIQEIVDFSKDNINKRHKKYVEDGRIKFVLGDGRQGLQEHAPYQFIHVGAGCTEIPEALFDQLAPGGLIWIPVGPKNGTKKICMVTKDPEGKVKKTELMAVSYADMVSVEEQLSHSNHAGSLLHLMFAPEESD
jgi:protein-L-isoaspartate(D-aspartate) O-methyltransferase